VVFMVYPLDVPRNGVYDVSIGGPRNGVYGVSIGRST